MPRELRFDPKKKPLNKKYKEPIISKEATKGENELTKQANNEKRRKDHLGAPTIQHIIL